MSGPAETIRVLPREMRLQTDRILFLTGLPKGYVTQATDVVILSECLGLGGFELLERRFASLAQADPAAIRIASEGSGVVELDAAGQHAWFVVPALLDLLAEGASSGATATVGVAGAVDAGELAVALTLGERFGLAVDIAKSSEARVVFTATSTKRSADGLDATFRRAFAAGIEVDAALWWRLYKLSNGALAADSALSRRHAGPLIVLDDGQVIGRQDSDDDTDLSFIKTAAPDATEPAA